MGSEGVFNSNESASRSPKSGEPNQLQRMRSNRQAFKPRNQRNGISLDKRQSRGGSGDEVQSKTSLINRSKTFGDTKYIG